MILCVDGPRMRLPNTFITEPIFVSRTIIGPGAPVRWEPKKDFTSIYSNFSYLEASGWYWGAISASEAHSVLQGASEGTFLIRDSSHPLYLLTLSVKTGRGPTNVRIGYNLGRFFLDASSPVKSRLLSFPDVPSLVQHYVGSKSGEQGENTEEFDPIPSSTPKQCAVLLKLKKPIRCRQAFPSLQHLARLVINRHSTSTENLPLPKPILQYLKDYPFQL